MIKKWHGGGLCAQRTIYIYIHVSLSLSIYIYIYICIYIQRITRHRAFSFLICIVTVIFSNLFQDLLSKHIENKSAKNQPAVMFAVNITWYRCVQRYPVARYTNGTRTQGYQVMFTAKITANNIPNNKS